MQQPNAALTGRRCWNVSGNGSSDPADPCEAFDECGGSICSNALVEHLREQGVQMPMSVVARWIAERDVVVVRRAALTLLPRFQFDRHATVPSEAARRVVLELRDVLDDAGLAEWFSMPNIWLAGSRPAHALALDPHEVFEAARADRFVLRG